MSTIPLQQQCRLLNSARNGRRNTTGGLRTNRRSSGVEKRCSSAHIVKGCQDDELIIEDLEPSLQPSCTDSSSSLESLARARSADSSNSRSSADVLARGDFVAYQGADLSAFFGESLEPQRVSEVCLVNDHFILVKMPGSYGRHNSQMECIVEEVSGSGSASRDPLTVATNDVVARRERGRFGRYFRCKRNRRISPEQNELKNSNERAEPSTKMKLKCPMSYCWRANGDEHETFPTCTKVDSIWNTRQSGAKIINIEPKLVEAAEALDLSGKRLRMQRSVTQPANSIDAASPLKTPPIELGGTHGQPDHRQLQTSLHDAVQLEQHATLVTPLKFRQNGQRSKTFQSAEHSARGGQKPKLTRRMGAFHWLVKSLRSRDGKPKSRPKIHAVVYKTYFVRWTKPPDELCQCCGKAKSRRSNSMDDVARLRRSRSATF